MRAQPIGNGLLVARVPEHLAAVLAALQLQGSSVDGLISLDDAGWREVLALSDRMQLTLPLALHRSKEFPAWVNERLIGNLADVARRFGRVQAAYCEGAEALDRAGVPHLVLKGFTLSPDFVKSPQFRMQGDIDFYTPREHTHVARDALEAIGYEPVGPAEDYRNSDHAPTLIRFGGWRWRGNLFDPEMPLAVEVHNCLWNAQVSLISLPEVDDFWTRRISRRLGDMSFCSLDLIDQLGYFALHLLRDLFQSQRVVHHALELATFLHERSDDTIFWREWGMRFSPRLKQIQAVALSLSGAGFSSRMPDAVEEQIHCLPKEQRAWIEICGGDLLTEAFRRTRDGRLLQFLLSNSAGARRTILWKALSPGVIASPTKVANQPAHPGEPPIRQRRRFLRYPAYLTSRIFLNGAAVLRLITNGLTVFFYRVASVHEAGD
jgi:Uncharacterised nucleotidyltransferase